MSRISRRSLLMLLATLSLVAFTAGSAQAKAYKVTGQQTQITLRTQTVQFLTNHQVTVTAIAPATISGRTLTLPISGGTVSKNGQRGKLRHRGAVKLSQGSASIRLSHFVVVGHGQHVRVLARVGRDRITVAHLIDVTRTLTSTGGTLTGELKLSKAAAHRINHRFHQHVVTAGTDLGSLTSTVTAA